MDSEITNRIKSLKEDLTQQLDVQTLLNKHIIECENYFFNFYIDKPDLEVKFKQIISDYLDVSLDDIFIVGSAQTGYSLSPKKMYNSFDLQFKETNLKKKKSDIDVAIVSAELFNKIGKSIYNFTNSYKIKWEYNEYYNQMNIGQFDVPLNYKHFEYYTKGWFRPDFRPIGFDFCSKGNYEELKQQIQNLIQRKIGLAIYSESYYFEQYHFENLKRLRNSSKTTVL